MRMLEQARRQTFIALAAFPEIAAAIFYAAHGGKLIGACGVKTICSESGLPQAQESRVQYTLEAGELAGAFRRRTPSTWTLVDGFPYEQLALMLDGAAVYANDVHKPMDAVEVILTTPRKPSRLEAALRACGHQAAFLERTAETFDHLAASATVRFLVMTPFVDVSGADNLIELFSKTRPGVKRELIIRCKQSETLMSLSARRAEFVALDVAIYNYWITREPLGRYETFHAKVLLSDHAKAYVGSANMTEASLSFSMELGFMAEGKAARLVASICETVKSISTPLWD